MAGDKIKRFSGTKHNNDDDDFNFDSEVSIELGEFGSPTEASRKPVESFKAGVKAGFGGHFVDPETYKSVIKDNFPDTYGKVIEGADDSIGAISDIYRSAGKAIKPAVKDLKRIAKMATPAAEKVLPKGLAERLKRWGEPEKEYGASATDMREASIKADLESVFVARDKEAFQQRTEDIAREQIKEGVEQIRHTDMLGTLNVIKDSTSRVAAYQDSTLVNYQRMSLTTQLRSYALQAEDSQLTRAWMETMRASTEDIKKNTSLPDFVKRHTVEDLKAMSRNRLIGKTLNMVGDNTKFIKDWGKKISDQVSNSLSGVVSGFMQGSSMILDNIESGAETGIDMNEMAGDMVGGGLAEKAGNWVAEKAITPMKESKNPIAVWIRKQGYKLATKKANMKDELTRESRAGYGEETVWSRFLALTLPTEDNQASIQTHTTQNLQEKAVYDQQSRRTLNEAIPGYFARVLRELQIIRTGNVNIGLTRFDFGSGKFIGDAELKNKLFKSIVSDDAVSSKKYGTESMLALIDKDGTKLSPEARKALHEQLMSDRKTGNGRTTSEFMDPSKYGGSAAPHAHQIAKAFQEYIGKGDTEDFKGGDGNTEEQLQKSMKMHKTFQNIGMYSQVDAGLIQTLYNSGYGQELEDMGVIKNGSVDTAKLMEYMSGEATYNPTGGSINAVGMNDKPMRKAPKGRDSLEASPERGRVRNAHQGVDNMMPQIDPAASKQGFKDVVDAIRANSTKSAVDMMLENVKHIEAVSINSNEALWKIAEGSGAGSGGGGKKPKWWNRSVGSLASGGASMIGRGIGNAAGLIGKAAGQGLEAAKTVGRFGLKHAGIIPKTIKGAWDLGSKVVKGTWDKGSSIVKSALNWKKEVADVWFRDEVMPRLSAAKLKAGEYFDQATNKVISSWKDIKGTVVDKFGEIVISAKDLLGTYVKLPWLKEQWEKIKKAGNSTWDTITGVLTGKINAMDMMRMAGSKAKDMLGSASRSLNGDYQDVYKVSDLTRPLLKGEDIKAGRYFKTTPEGEPAEMLKSAFDITTPIVNNWGSQVIMQAEITEGLCDKRGKPLKARGGIVKNAIASLKNRVMGGLSAIKGFISGGIDGATGMLSELFGVAGFNNAARRSTNVLLQIRNLLDDRLAGEKMGYSSQTDEFFKETTPGGIKGSRTVRKLKIAARKLFRKGKKGVDDQGGMKGLYEKSMKGIKDAIANIGKKVNVFGDTDGDGVRNGSEADLTKRKGLLGRSKDGIAGKYKSMKKSASAKGGAIDMMQGIWKTLSSLAVIGPVLSTLTTVVGGLGTVLGSIGSMLGLGSGVAAAGAVVAETAVAGAAGAGVLTAGTAAAGTVAATVTAEAAVVAGSGAAATVGGGVLAGLFWPVTLAIGGGLLAYAAYRGVKAMMRTDYTPVNKLRLYQYGVDMLDDPNRGQDLLDLEQLIYPALILKDGESTIDPEKFKLEEALSIFGIDSKNEKQTKAFQYWFRRRFMPVFGASVSICKALTGSNNLKVVDDGKKEVMQAFFAKAKLINTDFNMVLSPWAGDTGGFISKAKQLPINAKILTARIEVLQIEMDKLEQKKKTNGIISEAGGKSLEQSVPGTQPATPYVSDGKEPVGDGTEGVIRDALKGMADSRSGSTTSMTASNADNIIDHTGVADELFSIRMRAYGLTKLDVSKVQQLGRLERELAPLIVYKSDLATFECNVNECVTKFGPIFGIVGTNTVESGAFTVWFVYRFIPVYLAALTAAKRYTGKTNLLGGFLNLKQEHMIPTADAMIAATSSIGSVWKVPQTPWDKVEGNNDPKSCDIFLDNIRAKIKEALVTENTNKAAASTKPTTSSKPAPTATVSDGLQKAAEAAKVYSARDEYSDQATEGEKVMSVGSGPTGPTASSGSMAAGGLATGENGMQWLSFGKGVDLDGTNPEFKKNLLAMAEEYGAVTGKKLPINDAHRETAEQAKLYASMPKGRAAKPGTSLHEFGLAIDADSATLNELDKMGLMKKYGFTRPVGAEPWHVEPAGIQGNLNQAKQDPNVASNAVLNSVGGGGGGYGTEPGARKYGRDTALAVSLFNDKESIGTGPAATVKPETASVTPVAPAPTLTASIAPIKPTLATGNAEKAPKPVSTTASAGWGGKGGYGGGISNLRDNAVDTSKFASTATTPGTGQYAKVADVKGGDSQWSSYKDLITSASSVTGAPVQVMAAKAAVESGFRGSVSSGSSSASGLYQFTSGTWKDMMAKYSVKYGIPANATAIDPKANAIMAGLYYKENEKSLSGVTKSFGPVEAYAGHLLGTAGARKFLTGVNTTPDALCSTVVGGDAISGNAPYFTKDGRVLTCKESYDQIANNYQKKYTAFGVDRDLGALELPGVDSAGGNVTTGSGATLTNGAGGPVQWGKPTSGRISAAPTMPSQGYRASAAPTASTNDAYTPLAGSRNTSTSPVSSLMAPDQRSIYTSSAPASSNSPMNDNGAIARDTNALLGVSKDQLSVLTQVRDLLTTLVNGKPSTESTVPETKSDNSNVGFKPRTGNRTVTPSISMARTI